MIKKKKKFKIYLKTIALKIYVEWKEKHKLYMYIL